MGTMDEVIIENNTFQGVVGECLVIYEHVDEGSRVNHNTFANISMGAFYYYTVIIYKLLTISSTTLELMVSRQ